MTVTASASMSTVPVGPLLGVSKTKDENFTFSGSAVPVADVPTLFFAYGKSASAPGTYGALANPQGWAMTPDNWSTLSWTNPSPGFEAFMAKGVLTGPADASWSVGDHVWFCLFNTLTPSGSDVPLAVAGPLLVIA